MKRLFLFSALAISLAMLYSFIDSNHSEKEYIPVFMSREDLNRSVFYAATGRNLLYPGKIYYKANYIYINERYKGVHIINNSDPKNPVNEAFIVAPGCIDMAINGNILYLDNAVDLVAFDLLTKTVTKRIENVLPEPAAPNQYSYVYQRPEDMILVGWQKKN